MVDLLSIFRAVEDLPLAAIEQVHEYVNNQPHKLEKRKPTPQESREFAEGLQALITKLRVEIPPEPDDDPVKRLMGESRRSRKKGN